MEKIELSGMNPQSFTDKPMSRLHRFYLSGEVKAPSEYTSWFETIRASSDQDIIFIHINSYGGDLFTAIQFMRVLNETKATVIASVEGACMSAATIPFLCAKHWEISKHSMFMFHNYSSGAIGKGGELYDQIAHERKWSESLLKDIYSGFLTENEINAILENKDIWLSGEQVAERLNTRAKAQDGGSKAGNPKKKAIAKKPTKKAAKPTPAKKKVK